MGHAAAGQLSPRNPPGLRKPSKLLFEPHSVTFRNLAIQCGITPKKAPGRNVIFGRYSRRLGPLP
jgi:hypothetical protein